MHSGTGKYRVHGRDGRPEVARIIDVNIAVDVDEELYRARGYQPPFDELPWQDDHEARHGRSGSSG
jgi:hypothetical protein